MGMDAVSDASTSSHLLPESASSAPSSLSSLIPSSSTSHISVDGGNSSRVHTSRAASSIFLLPGAMLSVSRPHRDALLSPLPRGRSPWFTLNQAASQNSITAMMLDPHYHDDDHLSSSSRPETPIFTRSQRRRIFTRSGESGSAGGVLLIDPTRISPIARPKTREDSANISEFALDSPNGSIANSPPLHRKRGDISSFRLSQRLSGHLLQREKNEERIKTLAELEGVKSVRRSSYQAPAVEHIDDIFFTGVRTPEPPAPPAQVLQSSGDDLDMLFQPEAARGKQSEIGTIDLNSRRPSTIFEDHPECYTPTPGPKDSKISPSRLAGRQGSSRFDPTTASKRNVSMDGIKDKQAAEKHTGRNSPPPNSISPSTLLRLKYPTSHSATIEIQHTEGIKISGGRNGNAKIAIQVDLDSNHSYGYTSTIKTGRRGGMTVHVRPTSPGSYRGNATAVANKDYPVVEKDGARESEITEDLKRNEDGEDEVVIIPTPNKRKSRTRSKHSSLKGHHNGVVSTATDPAALPYPITPPPRHPSQAESVNLIDLQSIHSGPNSASSATPRKTVRKVEKVEDLKTPIHSARNSQQQQQPIDEHYNVIDSKYWNHEDHDMHRPIDEPESATTAILVRRKSVRESTGSSNVDATANSDTVVVDGDVMEDLGDGKQRPVSMISNVPMEVAWTMGVKGEPAGEFGENVQPQEEMAGGWI